MEPNGVSVEFVPVAIERIFAEANFCLVGCFSGRETGSMITFEAVLPEALAAEAATPEALPEEATLPEVMIAKATVPEAVAALKMAAPESAMISGPDFCESLGGGRLEVVTNRCQRQQRRGAERNRLGRRRLQDSQDAQDEAQG